MEYLKLAEIYEKIDATTKRLEMTDHLVDLFKSTPPNIIDKLIYLTQGKLCPDFKGVELGVADKLAVKAIAFATGYPEDEVSNQLIELGDLGLVTEDKVRTKKQTSLFSESLDIDMVYNNFEKIAGATGNKSQDLKFKLIAELLHDSSPVEAKYIVRSLTGKLRLGIADMTIIDALSIAFAEKENRAEIEHAYNICSDLGALGKALSEKGLQGAQEFKITVGIPIRAMLAERLSSISKILEKLNGHCAFEYKYDGLRIQAHIQDGNIELFSRRLECITSQFPDIIEALRESFQGKNAILEGECVPIDINTGEMLPFQTVSRRRGRKYELTSAIEEFPVVIFLFDCLYSDSDDFLNQIYQTRRKRLKSVIKENEMVKISDLLITSSEKEAEEYFEKSIDTGCEGLIAKSIADDSFYRAGARGWQWIKYKRDYKSEMTDTADLVIVGAFAGHGRRAGVYGALLMAAYNSTTSEYETVCKLGTGFSDNDLQLIHELLKETKVNIKPKNVNSKMKADFWFTPQTVIEVLGAEITFSPIHTCAFGELKTDAGLAIRFPRFTGNWRKDKGPEDATTSQELVGLYQGQLKKLES
jgi:DNA ligase-1